MTSPRHKGSVPNNRCRAPGNARAFPPTRDFCSIDQSGCQTSHLSCRVIHESMTSVSPAVRRDTKISASGTTRIRPVCSLVNLAKGVG